MYCSSSIDVCVPWQESLQIAEGFSSAAVLDVLDDDYQTWKLNGTVQDCSPCKGPPHAEVDKACADLFPCTSYGSDGIIRMLADSA